MEVVGAVTRYVYSCGGFLIGQLTKCTISMSADNAIEITCPNSMVAATLGQHRAALAKGAANAGLGCSKIRLFNQMRDKLISFDVDREAAKHTGLEPLTRIGLMEKALLATAFLGNDAAAAVVSMRTNRVIMANPMFNNLSQPSPNHQIPLLRWYQTFIVPFWEAEEDARSSPTKGEAEEYDYLREHRDFLPANLRRLYAALEKDSTVLGFEYKGSRPLPDEGKGSIKPDKQQPAEFAADFYLLHHYFGEPCRLCIHLGSRDL